MPDVGHSSRHRTPGGGKAPDQGGEEWLHRKRGTETGQLEGKRKKG